MPGSGDIRAGGAFVEIGAKDNMDKSLRRAEARMKAFGRVAEEVGGKLSSIGDFAQAVGAKFLGLGTAMAGGLGLAIKTFTTMGDEMAKASARTGVSVEALSQLAYAAGQSALDFDSLEKSIRHMQKVIVDAAGGSKEAAKALADLGLSAAALRGMSADKAMEKIADGLEAIHDPAKRATAAAAVFGDRMGARLLPLMAGGAKGMQDLRHQADALGLTMSTDSARAAEELADRLDDLWKTVKMGAFRIGAELGPSIRGIVLDMTAAAVSAGRWVSAHREVVKIAAGVTVAALGAGAGLVGLGVGLKVAGLAVSGLGTAIGGIATVLKLVANPLALFSTAVGVVASGLQLMTTPLALFGVGIVAIGLYAATGGRILETFGGAFQTLRDDATSSLKGITDAMSGDEFGLAAKILWATLKLEWHRGTAALDAIWLGFAQSFEETGLKATYGVMATWETMQAKLASGWVNLAATLSTGWIKFSGLVKSVWEGTQNYLAKKWIDLMGMFDKTLDVNAAKAMLDKGSQEAQGKIAQEATSRGATVEQNRQAAQSLNSQQFTANMAGIGAGYNKAVDDLHASTNSSTSADQKEIESLRSQLAALRRQAAAAASTGGHSSWSKLKKSIEDAMAGLADTQNSTQTIARGQFGGLGAQGALSGGNGIDRIVKAVDRQTGVMQAVLGVLKQSGITFGP
jgi:hypothetical protein